MSFITYMGIGESSRKLLGECGQRPARWPPGQAERVRYLSIQISAARAAKVIFVSGVLSSHLPTSVSLIEVYAVFLVVPAVKIIVVLHTDYTNRPRAVH